VAIVTVVGIGADGWPGLGARAQDELRHAEVIAGSARQLALLDRVDGIAAALHPWPTPLVPALPGFFETHRGRRIAVLASGDPMLFGIGSTLIRLLGSAEVDVLPAPSSVSLACARLGWPVEEVELITAVGRPLAGVQVAVEPGRRVLVLTTEAGAALQIAGLLTARGYGQSAMAVLERLGAPDEQIGHGTAAAWRGDDHDVLAIVAFECRDEPTAPLLPRVPGLPEDAFDHDGQITKREVRAMTLAALAPVPGQLLWDVGAGSGSVGIEWMRCHSANRAIAIEPRDDRRERIARNALELGVPALQIVAGAAPDALRGLDEPDAVFIGGGVSVPGVLDACFAALRGGGRLVANAVTLESEAALVEARGHLGGSLTRISVQHAEPVGSFTGWRPAMPVTQWAVRKGAS
jgi:precorrin-6Y C5,15-methyltransferase (decarboxylating)